MADDYKIKNGYANTTERFSFHLEIGKCNSKEVIKGDDGTVENYCKEDDKIIRVLNEIYFILYVWIDEPELGSTHNLGKNPLLAKNTFHS